MEYVRDNEGTNLPSPLVIHGQAILENTKQIYDRTTEQATSNCHVLLASVNANEHTRCDTAVQQAALEYQTDIDRYIQGTVDIDVPIKSHARLKRTIERVETDPNSSARREIERSCYLWRVVAGIGTILTIIGEILINLS